MNKHEKRLFFYIEAELARARKKFPRSRLTTIALMEEVGELAQAMMDKSRDEVHKEAVQVAVMAIRVILDGDESVNELRKEKGLDPLC